MFKGLKIIRLWMIVIWMPVLLGAGSIVKVTDTQDDRKYKVVLTDDIRQQHWDTLPQVKFWQYIMQLTPDTGVLNVKATRQILTKIPSDTWKDLEDAEKDTLRDSIRRMWGLAKDEGLYYTTGKRDYYSVKLALPGISEAIDIFKQDTVDPFYAQAILLIESPGKLKRSRSGAYGQFQLLSSVSRKAGLTVNRYKDERSQFDKSARAAAYLMRTLYIPATNQILEELAIDYDENAFWYKLLVLHVYHAGAYNVKRALQHAGVTKGNNQLIRTLWKTEYRRFRNASQNYTQLVLAAHLSLAEYLQTQCRDMEYCR